MNSNKYLRLRNYFEVNKTSSFVVHILFFILLLASNAHADFASNETSSTGMCPANHKMYYIGANPPASTSTSPVISQALSWTAGSNNKTFTFTEGSGNKEFVINFPILLDLNNSYGDTPPFFGSINGATASALNLVHNSPSIKNNNSMNVSINRSVSKTGYKIQDVDSTGTNGQIPYIEQVDVSSNKGQLTFNSNFHTINTSRDVVTARSGINCGAGGCTIDAAWNYNIANIALNLKHNNTLAQVNSPHAVGYSDFYFCLAPPKLIIQKTLNGNRVNDSNTKRDQFELTATGGSIATNSITTTGTGSTITNGTSATLTLAENISYTITERAMNGTVLGDIRGYNATYTCVNATTGSTTVMPTAAMTYNATAKTRSFTLANTTFGDEITCTITNSVNNYTFSGTVFNDNGNVSNPSKDDVSNKYLNNSFYFNGKYDSPTESGIPFTTGHTITLNKCVGDTGTFSPQTVNINSDGTYIFNLTPAQVGSNARLCTTQNEPNNYEYFVDTTSDVRQIDITNDKYNYPNNDFGDVIQSNGSLVLIKSQYVHSCNINSSYNGTTNNPSQTPIFITLDIKDIAPGNCIAYRVEAYNRGHVDLKDIQITDILQTVPVKSVFFSPFPLGNPIALNKNTSILPVDKIVSDKFDLVKPTGSSPTKASLYFNTKYGNTVNPQ